MATGGEFTAPQPGGKRQPRIRRRCSNDAVRGVYYAFALTSGDTSECIRNMQKPLALCLLLLFSGALTSSNGAIVWMCGLDDNGWPVGDGGGPNTSFLQENATTNPLPGSPITT